MQPHVGRNAENEFYAFSFKRRLYGSQPAHLGIKVLDLEELAFRFLLPIRTPLGVRTHA